MGNVEFNHETGKLILNENGECIIGNVQEGWASYPKKPQFSEAVLEVKYYRFNDTECKFMESLAEMLGGDNKRSGKIEIFSERDVCKSCKNVIKAFSEKYFNITITIKEGNGNSYSIKGGIEQ